jgi:hypothetical protein
MSRPIGRLAVVGTGLIGGSIAAAARRRGLAAQVVGAGPQSEQARALGLVDAAAPLAEAAGRGGTGGAGRARVGRSCRMLPRGGTRRWSPRRC